MSQNHPKYRPPEPIDLPDRRWPGRTIDRAPAWCSVDLRDGNQALPNPLRPEQKLEYFRLLCRIGFKHIEVAFPAASQDDFDFTRRLTDEGHVPADVSIMGLTQCREKLIERTFEAFRGAPRAIVHLYIAASDLHMKQVFRMTRADTIETAARAVRLARDLAAGSPETDWRLEFSPEEFTDTDPGFAVELSAAVLEAWGRATTQAPLLLNLPATVERRPPQQYADLIEWFLRRWPAADRTVLSLHAHNDQGMAVAATEMALLAGAQRVEGTLFGHGERTGNVDLVTMAMNLHSRGIATGLDFSFLPEIVEAVERLTGLPVNPRHPYAGELVFTAFSGSHQDAINKGMHQREASADLFGAGWRVPYLHVDPADVGRRYEKLIRINSQSGKGGVAWVLEQDFGIRVPRAMHPDLGAAVQRHSDRTGREVAPDEVRQVFEAEFLRPEGPYRLLGYWPRPDESVPTEVHGEVRLAVDGVEQTLKADGNGPISAFVHALQPVVPFRFQVEGYDEQAVGRGADATAYAFVPLRLADGKTVFGAGRGTNIDQAAVQAIVAALNRTARRA